MKDCYFRRYTVGYNPSDKLENAKKRTLNRLVSIFGRFCPLLSQKMLNLGTFYAHVKGSFLAIFPISLTNENIHPPNFALIFLVQYFPVLTNFHFEVSSVI